MSQAISSRESFSPLYTPSSEALDQSPVPTPDSYSVSTVENLGSSRSPFPDERVNSSSVFREDDSPKSFTLFEAARGAESKKVARLLEQKADVNQQDDEENTALHLAAAHVNGTETVALLLHAGARNKLNKQGKSAYQIAQEANSISTVDVFKKSRVFEFRPDTMLWQKEAGRIEKRRSPLTGRVMVICHDSTGRISKIYQHEQADASLGFGSWKICKPISVDNKPDTVRLTVRSRGRSEIDKQEILKHLHRLLFFAKQVGECRGVLLPDLIIGNRSVKDDTFSIDSYVKKYNRGDLFDFPKIFPVLSEIQKLQIFRDILWGLSAIHENKIAHCDIKPENILVHEMPDGKLKAALIDFDLCAYSNEENNIGGTPAYAAPEMTDSRVLKQSVEARQIADMWSLGIVLYSLVYKWKLPPLPGLTFSFEEMNPYYKRLQAVLESNPDAAVFPKPREDGLGLIIWQMLQYNKLKRITAKEALRQLEAIYPEHPPASSSAAAAAGSALETYQAKESGEVHSPSLKANPVDDTSG